MLSSVLLFLNIGTPEMMLIVFAALMLFGGKKLPELARGLGRGIREFKDASESIKRDISDQINNFEKDLEVKVDEPKHEEPKQLEQHTDDAGPVSGTAVGQPDSDEHYYNPDLKKQYYGDTEDGAADHPAAEPEEGASSGRESDPTASVDPGKHA